MSRKGANWRNAFKSGNVILRKVQMISIVDDDESVRESTKALVRSLGYAARAFASAEEFLGSDPDGTNCLIVDVQMKGLSGVELQDRLKAEGRRIPIIFITAFADDGTRSHVLEAGAIGFLRKPFSDDKLIHCLDSALAQYEC
jgi:FixJ family two-component response regulator